MNIDANGNLMVTPGVSPATQPVSGTVSVNALPAGTNQIGHIIADSGSVVAATLGAETTKVIGTVRNADGVGNLFTSNSTTPTAHFAQDANITSILGTAPTTAGFLDIKGADGNIFVRNATAANFLCTANIKGNSGATIDAAVGTLPTNNLAHIACPTSGAGGALSCVLKSAQATAVNIKSSAGNLYGFAIVSATATAGFIEFFNTATTATSGAVLAVPIAASGTVILSPAQIALLNFSTGIAINVATPLNGTTTQITWTGSVWYL